MHELSKVYNLDCLFEEFTHPGTALRMTVRNLGEFATKVMPKCIGRWGPIRAGSLENSVRWRGGAQGAPHGLANLHTAKPRPKDMLATVFFQVTSRTAVNSSRRRENSNM